MNFRMGFSVCAKDAVDSDRDCIGLVHHFE